MGNFNNSKSPVYGFLIYIYIILFIYLFLPVLGLPYCLQAFSSSGESGLSSSCGAQATHCSGFSCCGAQALGSWLQ